MNDAVEFDDQSHPTESIGFDFDEVDDHLTTELRVIINAKVDARVAEAVWEAVSRFAAEILAAKNPRLSLSAFCFAAGLMATQGKSMQSLANELGVSRAALSKRVVEITERLGLPPSRAMRSEEARKSDENKPNWRKALKCKK